jgi:hypothetical protein
LWIGGEWGLKLLSSAIKSTIPVIDYRFLLDERNAGNSEIPHRIAEKEK